MNQIFSLFHGHPARIVLTLVAGVVLAACSSQAPSAAQGNVPVTGQISSATPGAAPAAAYPPAGQAQVQATAPAAASPSTAYPPASQPTASTPASTAAACTAPAALKGADATLTPAVTEGPYFKAGSPERANLLDSSISGVTLTLSGSVLTADCQPVAHALLDFWQANAQGQYDNSGFTLRGHQYTDASGRFQLVTVVPGLYPGRTEHIHVKVQAPGGPILTTQLFFPGVTDNSSDGIYNPALLINIQGSAASSMQASYNFVIAVK